MEGQKAVFEKVVEILKADAGRTLKKTAYTTNNNSHFVSVTDENGNIIKPTSITVSVLLFSDKILKLSRSAYFKVIIYKI